MSDCEIVDGPKQSQVPVLLEATVNKLSITSFFERSGKLNFK